MLCCIDCYVGFGDGTNGGKGASSAPERSVFRGRLDPWSSCGHAARLEDLNLVPKHFMNCTGFPSSGNIDLPELQQIRDIWACHIWNQTSKSLAGGLNPLKMVVVYVNLVCLRMCLGPSCLLSLIHAVAHAALGHEPCAAQRRL